MARKAAKVPFGLGEGSDPSLMLAVRAHGNFTEYVPLGLLLLALVESKGNHSKGVCFLGGSLLAGRVAHAVALRWPYGEGYHNSLRLAGMSLTFASIAGSILLLAVSAQKCGHCNLVKNVK